MSCWHSLRDRTISASTFCRQLWNHTYEKSYWWISDQLSDITGERCHRCVLTVKCCSRFDLKVSKAAVMPDVRSDFGSSPFSPGLVDSFNDLTSSVSNSSLSGDNSETGEQHEISLSTQSWWGQWKEQILKHQSVMSYMTPPPPPEASPSSFDLTHPHFGLTGRLRHGNKHFRFKNRAQVKSRPMTSLFQLYLSLLQLFSCPIRPLPVPETKQKPLGKDFCLFLKTHKQQIHLFKERETSSWLLTLFLRDLRNTWKQKENSKCCQKIPELYSLFNSLLIKVLRPFEKLHKFTFCTIGY